MQTGREGGRVWTSKGRREGGRVWTTKGGGEGVDSSVNYLVSVGGNAEKRRASKTADVRIGP